MMRTVATAVVVAATVMVVGPATVANADEDFGQHVRMCAQEHGFDGAHNPGTHQGHSGWDPSHVCSHM
jgi:hypothetical protein